MNSLDNTPFEYSSVDEVRYDLFRKQLIWHNSEVCNECFQQVRSIGPEITKSIESQTLHLNQWYERTDHGSQEHTPWDNNKRFGTCYCLDCGSDCNGNHRQKTLEELKPLAVNILRYIRHQTPHDVDAEQFTRELVRLKKLPHAQGYESEILGLAFARSMDRATATQSSGSAQVAAD